MSFIPTTLAVYDAYYRLLMMGRLLSVLRKVLDKRQYG